MAVARWESRSEMAALHRGIDRLFDGFENETEDLLKTTLGETKGRRGKRAAEYVGQGATACSPDLLVDIRRPPQPATSQAAGTA